MANPVEASAHGRSAPGGVPARRTALYHEHLARKATLVERAGWLLPQTYGRIAAERDTLRQGVGLLDIGESGKINIKSSTLDQTLATSFPKVGAVTLGRYATDTATRICKLTDEEALVLTAPATAQETLDSLGSLAAGQPHTHIVDLTGALCGLRMRGPNAHAVLERLCPMDLGPDRLADGSVVQSYVARVHAIILRRDNAGITGYDIYVDRDLGSYVWECLVEAGAPLALAPVGRAAEEGGEA